MKSKKELITMNFKSLIKLFKNHEKYRNIYDNDNFWKLKRHNDYPNISFTFNITEREKYKRLYKSSQFSIDSENIFVLKSINTGDISYILTYNGDLYKKSHKTKIILSNVYNIYIYGIKLFIKDDQKNIAKYKNGKLDVIWPYGHTKKFVIGKYNSFVLTNNKILHIKYGENWYEYINNVVNFEIKDDNIIYLDKTNNLWQINYYRPSMCHLINCISNEVYFTPINNSTNIIQ